MIRQISVVALWVAATLVATAVAFAAVRSVAGQVVASPVSELLDATTTTAATAQAASTSGSLDATSFAAAEVTLPDLDDTATTEAASEQTTASLANTGGRGTPPPTTTPPRRKRDTTTTTTTTTRAPPPTTTTTAPPDDDDDETTTTEPPPSKSKKLTYQMTGGTVKIEVVPGAVILVAANPKHGFEVSIDDSGPDEVIVEFVSDDHVSGFSAEWDDDELEVEVEEEGEDGDSRSQELRRSHPGRNINAKEFTEALIGRVEAGSEVLADVVRHSRVASRTRLVEPPNRVSDRPRQRLRQLP